MAPEPNIVDTLRSAREAYRFLHEFQKRLRDTIERFKQEFPDHVYCASGPIYTEKPHFNKKSPHGSEKWVLDFFPGFAYSMRYEKQNVGERSSLLEICFYCDAAFDDVDEDSLPKESEASETKLEIYFWIKDDVLSEPFKWQDEWSNTREYPDLGEVDPYPELQMKVIGVALDFEKLREETGIIEEAIRVKKALKEHLNYS